jgi:uncharacterized protein
MSGKVPVTALARLADVLADAMGELEWSLVGSRDNWGRPTMLLRVSGGLRLGCQRCLKPLDFAVAIDSRLLLVKPGGDWPDDELEDDGLDAIEWSDEMDVLALVEDEVLLALPIAPRHADCELPGAVSNEQESSPFAALAQLKKH